MLLLPINCQKALKFKNHIDLSEKFELKKYQELSWYIRYYICLLQQQQQLKKGKVMSRLGCRKCN